ncbi:hypothetical protein ABMA28_003585 [Loxostege sticticalis]|uniref:Peptidase A2 domain-containing protein n=1 Tax=Loxostege sticticalis TaxID=481309 RepID=A0ABD0SWI9_LOXSC
MAGACAVQPSHRLCVTDYNTRLRFLIDTGANISVIPVKSKYINNECSDYKLYAANGTEIKTYGIRTLELNLGLRRAFKWTFVIADIRQPILKADFLNYYGLLVDIKSKKLIDNLTNLNVNASIINSREPAVKTVDEKHPYHSLLSRYPEITKPINFKELPKHNVCHHIETRGPPIFARARPLPPDRYKKAKEEFSLMQELGICRPSKNSRIQTSVTPVTLLLHLFGTF